MHVVGHATLRRLLSPGRTRYAAANLNLGFAPFELWIETLAPHSVADLLPQELDKVVLVLSGQGDLRIDGAAQRFRAPCSLILRAGDECEIVNVGTETMHFVFGFQADSGAYDIGPSLSP